MAITTPTPRRTHERTDPTVGVAVAPDLLPARGVPLPAAPPAAVPTSIRSAGVGDIPAIARITQEGPRLVGIEPELMSQATRLLLTLIAFEHGALWVEQVDGGPILRAVTAVPASELPPRASVVRDVAHQLGLPAAPIPSAVGLGQALLAELTAVGPAWVLIEISKASPRRPGDPALLGVALAWVREQLPLGPAPVMVLADSFPEREAAVSLGFVEHRNWGRGWPWWLGVAASAVAPPGE